MPTASSKLAQIIEQSDTLFMRYGLRNVSMEDIAAKLGMSKKTLYQEVDSKSDLIKAVMDKYIDEELANMAAIEEKAQNAIEEMIGMSTFVNEMLSRINPIVLYDMQKFYPEISAQMDAFHSTQVHEWIKLNLKKGQAEGYYRSDLCPTTIAQLHLHLMRAFKQDVQRLTQAEMADYHTQFVHYHIHGIVTDEGRALFQKYTMTTNEI